MIDKKELIKKALEAMKKSYAPYSGFNVGAVLLGKSGRIYTGCNVENSSYSITSCAERNALFKAVSEGERSFLAIAIVGGKGFGAKDFCSPCGACRQALSEFCDKDFSVILGKDSLEYKEYKLSELLPFSFKLEV